MPIRPPILLTIVIISLKLLCLVLFADLVGFTSWSSSREPPQVFALLEALYGAFDKIAKRRHVFKIETIGDW
jgi:class 3 adenylate cyclase